MENSGLDSSRKDAKTQRRFIWSVGVLECWSVGEGPAPTLQHSNIPVFHLFLCVLASLRGDFSFLFSSAFIPYHLMTSHVFSQISLNPYDLQVIEEIVLYQQKKLATLFNKDLYPKPDIYIYASTQAFQEATGSAWQIGGITQQGKMYLQPLATLKKKHSLETLLKHEYTHIFLEEHFPQLPLYLNEGISAFFSGLKLQAIPLVSYEQLAQWHNWANDPKNSKPT